MKTRCDIYISKSLSYFFKDLFIFNFVRLLKQFEVFTWRNTDESDYTIIITK